MTVPSPALAPALPVRDALPETEGLRQARESSLQLARLLRHEHDGRGEFLLALAEFDRDRLWEQLGYPRLFPYLHHELKLSNAAAWYRKVAARLIQRFPEVVEPIREGKLCLTALGDLSRVMNEENRGHIMPRFFHLSKKEARAVAAEILPAEVVQHREVVTGMPGSSQHGSSVFRLDETAMTQVGATPPGSPPPGPPPPTGTAAAAASRDPRDPSPLPISTEPLTAELCRLHITVSRRFLVKLDAARAGQSHAQAGATAGEVIETALDLLLDHQAKRRGASTRPQANPRASGPNHLPAAVRRAVWERDKGKCQWPRHDGKRCDSTHQLEVDHVVPRALGGPNTVDNCRLLCRIHNDLAARLTYGNDWMDQFTGGGGPAGGAPATVGERPS
jgi:hypothetical protein